MNEIYLKNIKQLLGENLFYKYLSSMKNSPVKSFRFNGAKLFNSDDNDSASQNVINNISSAFSIGKNAVVDTAYQIKSDEKLGDLWFHKAGLIYVQEPSSMMAVYGLKQMANFSGARVLDVCASPGGKTSQLSEMVGDNGFVLSNEINFKRANILRSNVERLGLKNVAISSCESSVLKSNLAGQFDAVLIDAPCSGEGMFRKDPASQREWSIGAVERNFNVSLQILNDGARCVKNGGFLVYSTCTFNTHENEEVVYEFLKNNSQFEIVELPKNIQSVSREGIAVCDCEELKKARRFYPFDNFGEGQFVCVLKNTLPENKNFSYLKPEIKNKQNAQKCHEFIKQNFNLENPILTELGSVYFLVNHNFANIKNLPLLTCGVALCEVNKNVVKPHHNFFTAYGDCCKNKINLKCDETDVNKFFKGEQLKKDVKDGFCAVCIEGFCVGFGKSKNGIINNHYPKGLRS